MRARRVLGVFGSVIGLTVTFASATAVGVLVHLDLPATRRLVATTVNEVLAAELMGKVEIEKIGGLGLRGVEGVRVRVRDPDGVQVLYVDDVSVRVKAIDAAKSALFEKGPIRIGVPSASIERADALLDANPAGDLRLAKAFEPKKKDAPKKDEPPGRGVEVDAPDVRLRHAWVRGTPAASAPPIDADLDDLVGQARIDPKRISADLDRVHLAARRLPRGLDPNGTITAHYAQGEDDASREVNATFEGTIAGMPATLDAAMHGDRVDARFDAFDTTGDRAALLAAELPQHEAFSLHVEAHGELPHVDAVAKVKLGTATVDVNASADTGEPKRVEAKVVARHLDLQDLAKGAPPSDLGFDAIGTLTATGDDVKANVALDTLPGIIENDRVPKIQVRGTYAKDSATVRARIHDAAMPTDVTAEVALKGKTTIIDAEVESLIPDLRKLPKVGDVAHGMVGIEGRARLVLPAKTIDAYATVKGKRVGKDNAEIGDAKIEAVATGTLDAPSIDITAKAAELHADAQPIERIDAKARVDIAPKSIEVKGAQVDVLRFGQKLGATVGLVRVAGPNIRVKDAVVEGLGDPIRADFAKDPAAIHVAVNAPKIELARVARVAQIEGVRSGTLDLRTDLTLRKNDAKGDLHVRLDKLTARDVTNASAAIDATLDGKTLDLQSKAALADAGSLSLDGSIALGGAPTDPRAWERAAGDLHVATELDLAKVTSIVKPPESVVSELRGLLVVKGTLRREAGDAPPEVSLHAHTLGLFVAGPAPTEPKVGEATEHRTAPTSRGPIVEVKGIPKWRSVGVDLGVDFRNDARSGLTDVAFRVTDNSGAVAVFDAKAILPYADLMADARSAKTKLVEAPLHARLVVPERPLALMPSVLGLKNARGKVDVDLEVAGSAVAPRVHLLARGRGVKATSGPLSTDADVELTYDGNKADLTTYVWSAKDKKRLLDLESHVDLDARQAILGGGELAWKANGKAKLTRFPLATIPSLVDRRIKGEVSGELSLDGLHEDAEAHAKIDLNGLEIGNAKYKSGTIVVDAKSGKLDGSVRLDQTDGFADIKASTGMTWGKSVAPALDTNGPIEARLVAKAFRAAAIAPFVEDALGALDGRIDADATVKISPTEKDVSMEGELALRDGMVHVVAIGEEFRGVRATATMRPDGSIEVKDVFARAPQGEVRADASLKLDGLRLESAKANIEIPKDRPLDLSAQGQPIGEVSGKTIITASSDPSGKKLSVAVDVPNLIVELPQTMKSGVQELEEKETIRVGTYRDRTTFVRLPLDKEDLEPKSKKEGEGAGGASTDIDVRLAKVTVQRGNTASVVLTGNPKISIDGGTSITGQIQAQSGWADVQGKKFEIERATITFNGEQPPNPVVGATAGWTSYDDTRIYADFVGPVKTGKVTLRSEPPRPKNEILSIILFGTADGANPTPPPPGRQPNGTTKAAVGLGGGIAAQGLTEALDDLAGIQATARIDTTRSNNPRPEVELQIAPRVSVSFSHVIGTPPITQPDKNLASVDWRFRRNWSLETTVGDRGRATLDAIWQKRY